MRRSSKIVLAIIIIIIVIVFAGNYFHKRHVRNLLHQEYVKALKQKKDEYINSFYQSSFSGVITYILQYVENPNKYVVEITDSAGNEKTIGKVEITNFLTVLEGDSIRKKPNSFELEISGREGKRLSIVKYDQLNLD